jgi:hypothetical protein
MFVGSDKIHEKLSLHDSSFDTEVVEEFEVVSFQTRVARSV